MKEKLSGYITAEFKNTCTLALRPLLVLRLTRVSTLPIHTAFPPTALGELHNCGNGSHSSSDLADFEPSCHLHFDVETLALTFPSLRRLLPLSRDEPW